MHSTRKRSSNLVLSLAAGSVLLSCISTSPLLAHSDSAPTYPNPVINQATVYTTCHDTGDKLTPTKLQPFTPLPQPQENDPCIFLDPTHRFQTIVGFGGAFTDSAAENFYKLSPAKQQEVLTAYFSPDKGIGYTLGRTTINSCDFSDSSYSYDDTPGDTKLTHFSIDHDMKYKIPFIKAAMAASGNKLNIFASPWSPPAWMKTNNDMEHGGKLKDEDRQAWADYFVRYVHAYQAAGVPIWGLTIQNEPLAVQSWESCIVTAQDEHEFIRDYLGPDLQKSGLSGVKLMIWDHNRGMMYQRAEEIYSDPKTSKYVWGMAYHWYSGDHFENPEPVHDAWPDKPLIFTEGTVYFWPGHLDDASQAEPYAKSEILDLNHWSTGWTEWNLILDQNGGPFHDGNPCSAPVIVDTTTGDVRYLTSYYYLGQFSKFIKPGAQRIACTSDDDRLIATAFINPDNSIATVVLNETDSTHDFKVWIDGRAVSAHTPAHSIETVVLSQ